jgi:hypothetical protein
MSLHVPPSSNDTDMRRVNAATGVAIAVLEFVGHREAPIDTCEGVVKFTPQTPMAYCS